jgi:hypothetical protein
VILLALRGLKIKEKTFFFFVYPLFLGSIFWKDFRQKNTGNFDSKKLKLFLLHA